MRGKPGRLPRPAPGQALFGLARNARLEAEIAGELAEAVAESQATGRKARRFKDFMWTTLDSWSRRRRVVGKAECTGGDPNPRFIVTSLKPKAAAARYLYERVYCARGEMENRIKSLPRRRPGNASSISSPTALPAIPCAPTSCACGSPRCAMAYVLLCALRRIGLAHTQFAAATCGTIRLALLKIGALVRVSVRRIHLAMASGYPWQNEFRLAHARRAGAAR